MSSDSGSELHAFYEFLTLRIQRGEGALSPEVALDLWRAEHPASDDVLALEEALADMRAGDTGTPLEECNRRFRERHGLPAES